jgi:ABC-type branched-subunit amino acid transport system substrate-binding protein
MINMRRTAVAVASLVALTACSTDAPGGEGEDSAAQGSEVRTGSGVTEDTISVGTLTDLSGPFAAGAAVQATEMQAYWDAVNADGGVCERDVEMQVQDHGYDPQRAVSLYRSMAPNVVALQQVLGSPTAAAVLPLAGEDGMYVGGIGWASVGLDYEVAQVPGATYSIEGANAIDYMVDELGVAEGSKIGHVYFVGDYGSDALKGSQHAAEERGVEIVPVEITPRDSDLSAQAAALEREGIKGVILSAAPTQLGSLAGVFGSRGINVPIVGNTPTFNPALLDTPARQALIDNFHGITAIAPYAGEGAGPERAVELYEAAAPDGQPGWEVPLAYAQAQLLHRALEDACENGDLTPEGVVTAMRELSDFESDGIFPGPLDYTEASEPPTRSNFVSKVDAAVPGGLVVQSDIEGPSAQSYTFE